LPALVSHSDVLEDAMNTVHRSSIALIAGSFAVACGLLSGCIGNEPMGGYQSAMSGNPANGKALIQTYGCGSCHVIPGIRTARGMVGPPLFYYSRRTIIAGELPNTPQNLVTWIKNPVAVEPGTAMPALGVSDSQAHDIAAYLYTLR
jgi:cytochrome c2